MSCAALIIQYFDQLWLWATAGAFAGLFLFYRGFRTLQRKRLILNTPQSKIRSASLGLIEVSGLATGPYVINAPVTEKPCYFYRTLAWELRNSGKNQEWKKVADETLHVPFYIDDNTGLLLVNPQGAETDLHRDFREEYSNSFFSIEEMPQAVRSFLFRYGIAGDHKVRVEEYCIKPKNALFVLGTLTENPGVDVSSKPVHTQAANIVNLNLPGSNGQQKTDIALQPSPSTFVSSVKVNTESEQEIINLSPTPKPLSASEMTQQGKIAAAMLKAGISNPAAWSAAGIDDPAAAMAMTSQTSLLPTGGAGATPAPAPEQFDLHPKVVLMKGENNPAFFISWRSQREIVSSLGWKAIACIWGGPALILISVYILLARLERL